MKLELNGAVCVLTGRMKSMTKAEATQRLRAAGARVTSSVSAKTDFVVVAEQWTNVHTSAKAMGLPVLSEAQLAALLDNQEIDVEAPGESADRSINELLGEVRSIMQGTPNTEMWHALIKVLDACQERDVHLLTEYIDGYIARWTQERMQDQRATTIDLTQLKEEEISTRRWLWRNYESLLGELRVAPEHWLGELQQGVRSPKFGLVRALDLRDSGITSKAVITLLDHPDMTNLHVLKLSSDLKMSGALIKRICQDTRLRDLGPGEVGAKANQAFLEYGQADSSLQTLDLMCYRKQWHDDTCEFLTSSSFHGVETLALRSSDSYLKEVLSYLNQTGALANVRRLCVTPYSGGVDMVWRYVLKSPWVIKHMRELDLGEGRYHAQHDKGSWKQLLDVDYQGHLERLELHGIRERDNEENTNNINKMLLQYLPKSRLLQHVDTLVLGIWKTPQLSEKLAQTLPNLTLE